MAMLGAGMSWITGETNPGPPLAAASDQPGAGVDLHLQPGDVTSVIRGKE